MIDIDVLKSKRLGSPEGARTFAAFLRTKFPTLYVEASTGGKGQELWTALCDAGDFARPWNHHRWKAILDWMSEMGRLDWQDHRYQIGTGRGDGQACRWRLHEEFVQLLDWLALHQEEGKAPFVDTGVVQRGRGEPLKPLRYWFRQAEEALLWSEVEKAMDNLWAA
jgi:hypothetical protein